MPTAAGLTGCNRNVKSRDERRLTLPPLTSPRSAVIFVEKAAAACAAPALKYFCSILHHNLAFTQNLGLTRIYVTVWSIFATSVSKINFEILKQRIEGQLFFLIAVGIAESFFVTVTCVFIPYDVPHYAEIVMLFTTLTITSFVKFVVIVMTITKLNIKYIVQEIDSQNEKCTEARVKLDEIYHRTLNKEKKS